MLSVQELHNSDQFGSDFIRPGTPPLNADPRASGRAHAEPGPSVKEEEAKRARTEALISRDFQVQNRGQAQQDSYVGMTRDMSGYTVDKDGNVVFNTRAQAQEASRRDQLMPEGWNDSKEERQRQVEADPRNETALLAPTEQDVDDFLETTMLQRRKMVSSGRGPARSGQTHIGGGNPLFDRFQGLDEKMWEDPEGGSGERRTGDPRMTDDYVRKHGGVPYGEAEAVGGRGPVVPEFIPAGLF